MQQHYELYVRLGQNVTTRTVVRAENGYIAMLMGEAVYGKGNVISFSPISDQAAKQYR